MTLLKRTNLPTVSTIVKSGYNRSEIRAGILHIGLGNFHRAHQAVFMDSLLHMGGHNNWGIVSSVIRREQRELIENMRKQDGLYTLMTVSPKNKKETKIIGSIIDFIDGTVSPQLLADAISDPAIKMILFTVTEGGYYLSQDENTLMTEHADIQTDLSGGFRTIYSFLREGLKKRMENGAGPLTLLSCDNLRFNGRILRKGLLFFLELMKEPELIKWCESHASFPNSMVDRITPKTYPDLSKEIQSEYGYTDKVPVLAEDFIQWVLEDDFAAERPKFEDVSVEIVNDIYEQEETKIRMLNGGHCAIAWFAALHGHQFFHEALENANLSNFLDAYINQEVIPTLQNKNMDPDEYFRIIKNRFSNRHIPDSIERLAAEGASRIPKFILPVIYDRIEQGKSCALGCGVVAAWFTALERNRKNELHYTLHEQEMNLVEGWFETENPYESFIGDQSFWKYGSASEEKFKSELRIAGKRIKEYNFYPLPNE